MSRKINLWLSIGFMLFSALFLLHALNNSLVLAHQGRKPAIALQQKFMLIQKELVEDVDVAKRNNFGGRKMIAFEGKTRSKRDGTMSSNLSAGPNKDNGNHENVSEMEPASGPSAALHKQVANKAAVVARLPNGKASSRRDYEEETKRVMEKEIMNFMCRDYRGYRRPRRKPPINNGGPRD